MSPHVWSIVLAAGAGRRLASVTGGVPKQFWTSNGSPTLLEDTLRRSAQVVPPERTVILVDRGHEPHVASRPALRRSGRVIYQPRDRGTAAGVLLGLSHVLAEDPRAIVLLTPSDHGVARPEFFTAGIRSAIRKVQSRRTDIVLFGVEPAEPEGDYGWIVPSSRRLKGLRHVARFVEKPEISMARALFDAGSVWNTMVLVARAAALLDRYRLHLTGLTKVFLNALDRPVEDRALFLARQYEDLPAADFSRDLLESVHDMTVHVWPSTMGWSDLGTPERLAAWQQRFEPRPGGPIPARRPALRAAS